MNWIDFLRGIYYSLLPKRNWGNWRPSSTVDFLYSAMLSAGIESILGATLLIRGGIHFVMARTLQLKPLPDANEGTQLYFTGVLLLEYLFQPLSMFLLYLMGEGSIRWFAAWSTDEVLPNAALMILSRTQEWRKKKQQERSLGPIIPDMLETLKGGEYALRILSCRAKNGWRESVTVVVGEKLYELAKLGSGTTTHPFEYLLRDHAPGKVIRGMYQYEELIGEKPMLDS